MQRWTEDELYEVGRYFNGQINALTLFALLKKINPERTYESMMTYVRHLRESGMKMRKELATQSLRVGYLDIEASNLNGDFGMILSWYIKTAGKNEYRYSVIKKDEIFNYQFDKRVVEELLDALKHYDVLYAHWGTDGKFDFPFIRTRAYINKLEHKLPMHMEKFIMDTWPTARLKLKLHNNRLDSIAEALGIGVKKTPLKPMTWMLASVGHPKSLEYIALHNKRDVQILERVHQKMKRIEKPIYRSM